MGLSVRSVLNTPLGLCCDAVLAFIGACRETLPRTWIRRHVLKFVRKTAIFEIDVNEASLGTARRSTGMCVERAPVNYVPELEGCFGDTKNLFGRE